jgi:uncharacterized protein with GYD domain
MATYLHIGSYTRSGAVALRDAGGSARAAAVRDAVESVGGTVQAIYWGFGASRVYAILELPDDLTATALNLAVDAAGALELETVRLHSAEEIDLAARQARSYDPPGTGV